GHTARDRGWATTRFTLLVPCWRGWLTTGRATSKSTGAPTGRACRRWASPAGWPATWYPTPARCRSISDSPRTARWPVPSSTSAPTSSPPAPQRSAATSRTPPPPDPDMETYRGQEGVDNPDLAPYRGGEGHT